jgi:hypothetical protein
MNNPEELDISTSLAKVPRFPTSKAEMELREMTYTHIFEYALDYIASGTPMTSILSNDPRNIDYARFLRWIKKNPLRHQRYCEAQEIAAEILVDKMDHLIDKMTNDGMAVDQQKFNFEVLKYKAGSWNKKKYGNNKHVELTSNGLDDNKLKTLSSDDLKKMYIEQAGIDPDSVGLGEDGDDL